MQIPAEKTWRCASHRRWTRCLPLGQAATSPFRYDPSSLRHIVLGSQTALLGPITRSGIAKRCRALLLPFPPLMSQSIVSLCGCQAMQTAARSSATVSSIETQACSLNARPSCKVSGHAECMLNPRWPFNSHTSNRACRLTLRVLLMLAPRSKRSATTSAWPCTRAIPIAVSDLCDVQLSSSLGRSLNCGRVEWFATFVEQRSRHSTRTSRAGTLP